MDALTYSYLVALDHPSGLFWIHPHPHGQSEIQLSNGVSGLLAIGSVWDTLFFRCRLTASLADAAGACKTQEDQVRERALEDLAKGGALRVRYLGLKDIQVRPHTNGPTASGGKYDLIPFPHRPGTVNQAFSDANNARKSRCGNLPRPEGDNDVIVPGAITVPQGICRGSDGTGWAFTVSAKGAVFSQVIMSGSPIDSRPGKSRYWRTHQRSCAKRFQLVRSV